MKQKLDAEADRAAHSEKQRLTLEKKLQSMQEKLMQGGKLLDKAAKQEAMLRRAQLELEERKEQEQALARQVRAKEEDMLESVGNDTAEFRWVGDAFHGESFSCPRLTVCEYSSVVTIKHSLDNRSTALVVDGLLCTVCCKNRIKSK